MFVDCCIFSNCFQCEIKPLLRRLATSHFCMRFPHCSTFSKSLHWLTKPAYALQKYNAMRKTLKETGCGNAPFSRVATFNLHTHFQLCSAFLKHFSIGSSIHCKCFKNVQSTVKNESVNGMCQQPVNKEIIGST